MVDIGHVPAVKRFNVRTMRLKPAGTTKGAREKRRDGCLVEAVDLLPGGRRPRGGAVRRGRGCGAGSGECPWPFERHGSMDRHPVFRSLGDRTELSRMVSRLAPGG